MKSLIQNRSFLFSRKIWILVHISHHSYVRISPLTSVLFYTFIGQINLLSEKSISNKIYWWNTRSKVVYKGIFCQFAFTTTFKTYDMRIREIFIYPSGHSFEIHVIWELSCLQWLYIMLTQWSEGMNILKKKSQFQNQLSFLKFQKFCLHYEK